jgi:hypothetical protein
MESRRATQLAYVTSIRREPPNGLRLTPVSRLLPPSLAAFAATADRFLADIALALAESPCKPPLWPLSFLFFVKIPQRPFSGRSYMTALVAKAIVG